MTGATVEVSTRPDGTLVIQPRGSLDVTHAVDLRHAVVHAIRHTRPPRLVLDLADVLHLDSTNVGTLAAACLIGDDHQVAVFLEHSSTAMADRLTAAGVPVHRLRRVAVDTRTPGEPPQ
jgi:anti-anti-sigma factor